MKYLNFKNAEVKKEFEALSLEEQMKILKRDQPNAFDAAFNAGLQQEKNRIENWKCLSGLSQADVWAGIQSGVEPSDTDVFYSQVDNKMKTIKR